MLEKSQTQVDPTFDVINYRVELYQYEIEEGNPIIGHTIRDLNFQKKTDCLITSIERSGKMLVKFSADFEFNQGDILWLAGEKKKIECVEESLLK